MPRSIHVQRLWERLHPHLPPAKAAPALTDEALAPEANAAAAAAVSAEAPDITGDVRIHKDFASNILKNTRDLWVYVPPGYDAASEERYPVLYMHDGNNLFEADAAFGGQAWDVDETVEHLIRAGQLPPLLIVGVSNSSARLEEYTWVKGDDQTGGHGAAHARFLLEEVRPFINELYRTSPAREDTGILGSSLGGLDALYLGALHGEVFGKVGAMSPSIWWDGRRVLTDLAALRTDLRIWLDMGSHEGDDPAEWARNLADAVALRQLLESRGYVDGRNLLCWEAEGAEHNERAWACRLAIALLFLFTDEAA